MKNSHSFPELVYRISAIFVFVLIAGRTTPATCQVAPNPSAVDNSKPSASSKFGPDATINVGKGAMAVGHSWSDGR